MELFLLLAFVLWCVNYRMKKAKAAAGQAIGKALDNPKVKQHCTEVGAGILKAVLRK